MSLDPSVEGGGSWHIDSSQENTRFSVDHSPSTRQPRFCLLVMLLFTSSSFSVGSAFLTGSSISCRNTQVRPFGGQFSLQIVPLSRFSSDLTFFSEDRSHRLCFDQEGIYSDGNDEFELALVQEEDLPDLSRFIVAAFGADAIRLSQDVNAFERMLLSPATELLNSYSNLVAFAEVFQGTKQRLSKRFEKMDLSPPNIKGLSGEEAINVVERDSLVLVVARPSKHRDSETEIIASIELRLQPCDAKIPFSLPWLDKVERRLASVIGLGDASPKDLQPYLSNLCVDEKYRGKKIGKAMVRVVENIAKSTWGLNRMYLHVDEDNEAALSLYKREGYHDVGHRWNPFWAGNASRIGYYVKTIIGSRKP